MRMGRHLGKRRRVSEERRPHRQCREFGFERGDLGSGKGVVDDHETFRLKLTDLLGPGHRQALVPQRRGGIGMFHSTLISLFQPLYHRSVRQQRTRGRRVCRYRPEMLALALRRAFVRFFQRLLVLDGHRLKIGFGGKATLAII